MQVSAGFRFPHWDKLIAGACDVTANELLAQPGQAMIRELHVYGQALAQKECLLSIRAGPKASSKASSIAAEAGYTSLNVISSIGTRAHYRAQGFLLMQDSTSKKLCRKVACNSSQFLPRLL